MRLELELECDQASPGDVVAGCVRVLEGGPSRSLTLTIGFHEQARGYAATPYTSSWVLEEGELTDGDVVPFRFELPAEAPPSVKAKHSELYWELRVESDQAGFDAHARRRLEVVAEPSVERATFVCVACGDVAGTIELEGSGASVQARRATFTGVLTEPVTAVDELRAALAARDARGVFELDPELAPFFCPACADSYCGAHWQRWDVFDDDMPQLRDCIRGRCPRGHERMLED